MGIINILDKSIAELIAAGEVVERPSSVIKELTENAIDAGATAITVEIKNGGVKYIRITDNGTGIAKDDVPKAFLRHATSKVCQANDLDSIATLGFRGEALASICAVARVQMMTRYKDEDTGTLYEIEASEEKTYEEAGCPQGTTIIVRDIFYNVPARMKFLKKDVAEGNAIANIMDKLAMSHSEISFTFIRDGKQVLKTPGDKKLKSAIYAVYGKEFVSKLIPMEYSFNGVSIKGYITRPEFGRVNRNMQNFFINGRYVKSVTAGKALEEAYKGKIMVGKIPSCVLHITLPLESIDVNVHPSKTEVRFINERPVFDVVYHGTKTALLQSDSPKEIRLDNVAVNPVVRKNPFRFDESNKEKTESQPMVQKTPSLAVYRENTASRIIQKDVAEPEIFIPSKCVFGGTGVISKTETEKPENHVESSTEIHTESTLTDILKTVSSVDGTFEKETIVTDISVPESAIQKTAEEKRFISETSVFESTVQERAEENSLISETTVQATEENNSVPEIFPTVKEELRYLGEAFSTYIMVQKGKDKILCIDKHAAHERMIYEKLKKEHGKGYMQGLITPVVVTLTKEEYPILIDNIERLKAYNFDIDDFGNGKVAVRGIPQYVEKGSIEDMIVEIADNLLSRKKDLNTEQMDWVYHSVSCRSAIKAGNKNHEIELMELARTVDEDETIRYCPHGRPVCFVLTKKELEKQFGRV